MQRRGNTQPIGVWLGEAARSVGTLGFASQGQRQSSMFQYDQAWLADPSRFEISPDLPLTPDRQFRKAPGRHDSVFHFAIADTEPDGWGCRVIARDHAQRLKQAASMGETVASRALTEMDYLLGVDDISRIGALRLRDADGRFVRAIEDGQRGTPPLLELADILNASHAVERGTETERDLRYLRGRGTSLGGMRPKCTVIDEDGHLAIGKFPSIHDHRAVTKGEVLALRLATLAGIDAAQARVVPSDGVPVALVRRFDRVAGGRVPYLSATAMLQASRDHEHAYTEIAERILSVAPDARRDLAELWRRIVFNMLITNVDDHLHNHGFLHVGHGQWQLAPAFDLNPFPDKERELKTWLTEESGPTGSVDDALAAAPYFHLQPDTALRILGEVVRAVSQWREVAKSPGVDMTSQEVDAFEPAFEHEELRLARRRLSRIGVQSEIEQKKRAR
ncbi:type II toxin-antitoxin system HipA family toxin [Candidatus Accumulibacter aalborgensis]|uniref:type II toxin-antitoxin system HipA family toxin n=1 Tax=Candidatus Accumulibacter aalborgensis TaxID=1860102 RepID=UPI001FE1245A|nr:type II toxin-antitoxin system HipA family toxin [Candidatus Accumulibacter aalborgensis]